MHPSSIFLFFLFLHFPPCLSVVLSCALVNKMGKSLLNISIFLPLCLSSFLPLPPALFRPTLGPSARPVLLSDNVKMLNHTTRATTASLPISFCEGSPVSLCAVILSSHTHQYSMQDLHQPVYFSSNIRQGDVWGLTRPLLMCMLMSLKYQTSFFLSVSCLFHSLNK